LLKRSVTHSERFKHIAQQIYHRINKIAHNAIQALIEPHMIMA